MYANISRSGTSSASTPQKPTQLQQFPQNLSLPGSAEMAEGRPSTRRGGRPGSQSQSGGSADGSGPTMAENEGQDENYQPNVGIYERRGTVDVWTRDQSARMHKNGENDDNEDSPKSSSTKSKGTSITNGQLKKKKSSISSQTSAENVINDHRRQSYPELSEPGNYSSEQFEESDEEEEEEDEIENEGRKNGHEGDVDDFSRKLREMASAAIRNRSLHESLQSSIQRGADAKKATTVKSPPSQSALPPSIGANRPGIGSRRSSKGSSAGGTAESREGANGNGDGRKWPPPIPMPRHFGGSSAGSKTNEEEAKRESAQGSSTSNSSGAGSTGTRIVESSRKGHSEAHSNGFHHQNEANNANAKHLLALNNGHSKGIEGIGGDGQRMKNMGFTFNFPPKEHLKPSTQIGMAETIQNNQKPSIMPQRLSVSRDGQRPTQRSTAPGFQEIGKVPLGFGSSSARNCLISASGRATKPTMPNKGANGEMRGRSASVSAIRNEENTAGYKGWLRQKLAEEKAKKEREAEKKEQEEKNKKEKRELAEKNFAHWKVEMDRKLAERKERERRMIEQKAKKEREEKDEKLTNAQRTFVYWKKTRDERSRAQKERSRSAEQRKREEIEQKKEEKRREADTAFQAWIQEADDRKRAREEMIEEEKTKKEIEKEKHGEMRKQIAQEAYGLWIHMKEEERKYKQSLAYRILDFERKSNAFIAPWIPTSPSTMAKVNRPPPELVQGRRRTLEKRLILPHSRPSHSAKSAKRMDGNGQLGGGGRQAKSAVGSRRPWR